MGGKCSAQKVNMRNRKLLFHFNKVLFVGEVAAQVPWTAGQKFGHFYLLGEKVLKSSSSQKGGVSSFSILL
jgi:hypothetical protein